MQPQLAQVEGSRLISRPFPILRLGDVSVIPTPPQCQTKRSGQENWHLLGQNTQHIWAERRYPANGIDHVTNCSRKLMGNPAVCLVATMKEKGAKAGVPTF